MQGGLVAQDEFVVAVGNDPVNAAADAAPGFAWRLQTDEGDATAVRAFDWDVGGSAGTIVNMSAWRDVEHLTTFAYGELHRQVLKRRREWFQRMSTAHTACWWVPAGHRPTTAEAEERIRRLRVHGPTSRAFTLRNSYPPPDTENSGQAVRGADDGPCPA